MSSQDVIETQTVLSEKLQLLSEMNYSDDVYMPYQFICPRGKTPTHTANTQSDISALDIIAVCLATGRAGDVVAAAFDKRAEFRLILAKNGQPTAQDVAATKNFLAAMTSAVDWADVIPFVFQHSKDNVIRRISQLHRSLSTFHPHLTESATCRMNPLDKEFPSSDSIRKAFYGAETLSFQSMLADIVRRCLDLSAPAASESISETNWTQLVFLSEVWRKSLILKELIKDKNLARNKERKAGAERLKRRLGKVCQYLRLDSLIKKVQKWFPDGNVPFHWVDYEYDGSGEGHFAPDPNPMKVIARGLQENKNLWQPRPLPPGDIAEVQRRFPNLIANWEKWQKIQTCVHAEIRVILHLDGSKQLSPRSIDRKAQQAVGCSKRSCLCCQIWIATFNWYSQREWVTSWSHGKADSNWALPGRHGWMGLVDGMVFDQVTTRLEGSLSWLDKEAKRREIEKSKGGCPCRVEDAEGVLARVAKREAEGKK